MEKKDWDAIEEFGITPNNSEYKDLLLMDSKVKKIPNNLTIKCNAYLSRSEICELPSGLNIKYGLYMRGTNIKSIPGDLVAECIYMWKDDLEGFETPYDEIVDNETYFQLNDNKIRAFVMSKSDLLNR